MPTVTEFKAKCLAYISEVERTGKSITITKRGKVVAKLGRADVDDKSERARIRKSLEGSVQILGDIVGPIIDPDDWHALNGKSLF